MRSLYLWTTVAFLTAQLPGYATDLSKIDRTIGKEPAYQSKPKYCLVVFGPEAKTRVWLVLDGDVLYVDRNGDGDLTANDERFPKKWVPGGTVYGVGTIPTHDGRESFALDVWESWEKSASDDDKINDRYKIRCWPQGGVSSLM